MLYERRFLIQLVRCACYVMAEVIAYYRVSTARQDDSGYGLEAQQVAAG